MITLLDILNITILNGFLNTWQTIVDTLQNATLIHKLLYITVGGPLFGFLIAVLAYINAITNIRASHETVVRRSSGKYLFNVFVVSSIIFSILGIYIGFVSKLV